LNKKDRFSAILKRTPSLSVSPNVPSESGSYRYRGETEDSKADTGTLASGTALLPEAFIQVSLNFR
jgi:hypothetical protein